MKVLSFLAALLLTFPVSASAQSASSPVPSPQRDPQALNILNQALAASGGATALSTVQDVTATGTVTYNWAGQQVQGTATARSRGISQFRIDAVLPQGVRSWAVSYGSGSLKETDGTLQPIPYYNALNLGGLTFPYFGIVAALQDSTTSVSDLGLINVDGRQARQIHTQRNVDAFKYTQSIVGNLMVKDYFIDPTTYQLLKVQDMAHPAQSLTGSYQHEISFSDYRSVNGLLVPFAISEKIAGQETWTIQLNQISFNTGLTDSDFQI